MARNILVVDDDPVIRALVSDTLVACGHAVESVEGGSQCLDRLRSGHLPDLVILDLLMPDMSGVEVLRGIRNSTHTSKLPVIMLSANSDAETIFDSEHIRANYYLKKPFKLDEILTVIKGLDGDSAESSAG